MMLRQIIYSAISGCILLSQATQAQTQSTYNYTETFDPIFYTKNGNSFRSASGKPGPAYWQNAADYVLKVSLDDKTDRIAGSVNIKYTNNSPEELNFIWLQLDQNLFNESSRGQAVVPLEDSRYGTADSDFDGGFSFSKVELADGSKAHYSIEDTRMRIELPTALKPGGNSIELQIDFAFTIPEYGADRTGILNTKNGKIYSIAQWYPRVCVFDDVLGWNTDPYTGPGEFYLEYGDYQVEITAPTDHIVVAGGELLNPEEVWTKDQLSRYLKASESDKTVMI